MLATDSLDQALRFMDDPGSLSRPLTWWSNGERGNWHSTPSCARATPDRMVRQRGSILEGQTRICGSCFPRALASIGVSRQWSAALQAARMSRLLDDVEAALGNRPTSGEALRWGQAARMAALECERFACAPSSLRAWPEAFRRCDSLIALAEEEAARSAVEVSRWAALVSVRAQHEWDADPAVSVLGPDPDGASPSMLAAVFDAFARELLLTGRMSLAVDAAHDLVRSACLSSLGQLAGVPAAVLHGDLHQLVERSWRSHALTLTGQRLDGWLRAYRRVARNRGMRAVGIPGTPVPGKVPDMVIAAIHGYGLPSSGRHVVMWCPAHVADAVVSLSGSRAAGEHGWDWGLPWLVESAVDAGACPRREHAEAFAVLWEPGAGSVMADAAHALRIASML